MGLDMYAMMIKEQPTTPVDFEPLDPQELHYWRKHPNLHGWMEALYYQKGGAADCFNCKTVTLTNDDLDRLEQTIRSNRLPQTAGFFFGHSDGSEHESDLKFIAKARAAIADGYCVFYDSWW